MSALPNTVQDLDFIGSEIKARLDFADKHADKAHSLYTSAAVLMESVEHNFEYLKELYEWTSEKTLRSPRTIERLWAEYGNPTARDERLAAQRLRDSEMREAARKYQEETRTRAAPQPVDAPHGTSPKPPKAQGRRQPPIVLDRARFVSALTEAQWARVLDFIKTL